MGRNIPVIIARAASIFLAGMMLFAMAHHARAQGYDGYGLKPLGQPDAKEYSLPSAAVDTSPAKTGEAPAPNPIPVSTKPATALPAPAIAAPSGGAPNAGLVPVPASAPAAVSLRPAITSQPVTQNRTPFGYRAGDGIANDHAVRPVLPTPAAQPMPTQPLGAPQANGYYQTLASQQPGYSPAPAIPGYVLGNGDKIKLTVFGETDLSGDFTIDGSGMVALPLIGQVKAAGYSAAQLEQGIGSALARGYLKSPRVSVEVSTYRPFYIIGAVNRPGEYPYVNHMNALNAVALAGGYQNNAVESVIFIRREGSNSEVELPTDRTTDIYPGDVVRVHFTILNDAMSIFSPLTGAAGIGIAAATVH